MKKLYAEFNRIISLAKNGYITLYEANIEMLKILDKKDFYDIYGEDDCFPVKMKAYHRMYKLLFDITKEG